MTHMQIHKATKDDAFFDGVVAGARSTPTIVRGLEQIPAATKDRLLGDDPVAARAAAREFYAHYFGECAPRFATVHHTE